MENKTSSLTEFDNHYTTTMDSIIKFFRYERQNGEVITGGFDDDYYKKVAQVMKNRIDHEIKHLHVNH